MNSGIGYGRYVGRIGGLAVALGVGLAVASAGGAGVAHADASEAGSTSEATSTDSAETSTGESSASESAESTGGDAADDGAEAEAETEAEADAEAEAEAELEAEVEAESEPEAEAELNAEAEAESAGEAEAGVEADAEAELDAEAEAEADTGTGAEPGTEEVPAGEGASDGEVADRSDADTSNATESAESVAVPDVDVDGSEVTLESTDAEEATGDTDSAEVVASAAATTELEDATPSAAEAQIASATVETVVDTSAVPAAPVYPTTLLGWLSWIGTQLQRMFSNRSPISTAQTVVVELDDPEDVSEPIEFVVLDPDEDEVVYSVPGQGEDGGPENGQVYLNQSTGTFVYDPDDDFALVGGTDTFTYTVSDEEDGFHWHGLLNYLFSPDHGHTSTATVTIVVVPANDAPVAVADDYVSVEDASIEVAGDAGVLANDSDADGDDLTAELVSGPEHGEVTLNADGTFVYTADADYNGTDSFTYQAFDGVAYSEVATVSITVLPMNDAPVAVADDYVSIEDGGIASYGYDFGVLANDSDVDGDVLTAELVSGPEHGELTLYEDGSFYYTSDADYNGTDSFTYRAFDGVAYSEAVTVSITVNPVNDAPVAEADFYASFEDAVLLGLTEDGVLANDSDVDGDDLTAELVSGPEHGELTLYEDGSFVYKADADYSGTDSFTYRAFDGVEYSEAVAVSITVSPVNDAPVAVANHYDLTEDGFISVFAPGVLLNDSDADGDDLTAELVSGPAHGELTLNADGSFYYTPDADYNGMDSFTYQAFDGVEYSEEVTVSITVSPVNDAPTGQPLTAVIDEGGSTNLDWLSTVTDVDGDELTAELVSQPTAGYAEIDNVSGNLLFTTFNSSFNGEVSFSYRVFDGTEYSEPIPVVITVNPVNDAPNAGLDILSVIEEDTPQEYDWLANASDPDGDALTATVTAAPSNGVLTVNADGLFVYTPNADFNGQDSFSYTVSDGGLTDTAKVSITVTPVNDDPVAPDASFTVDHDTETLLQLPAFDVDGDLLTLSVSGLARNVLESLVEGQTVGIYYNWVLVTVVNGPPFTGATDTFTYTVSDGNGTSQQATVTVTILA